MLLEVNALLRAMSMRLTHRIEIFSRPICRPALRERLGKARLARPRFAVEEDVYAAMSQPCSNQPVAHSFSLERRILLHKSVCRVNGKREDFAPLRTEFPLNDVPTGMRLKTSGGRSDLPFRPRRKLQFTDNATYAQVSLHRAILIEIPHAMRQFGIRGFGFLQVIEDRRNLQAHLPLRELDGSKESPLAGIKHRNSVSFL